MSSLSLSGYGLERELRHALASEPLAAAPPRACSLRALVGRLFEAERAAHRDLRRATKRAPRALSALAAHANDAIGELRALALSRGFRPSLVASALADLRAHLRSFVDPSVYGVDHVALARARLSMLAARELASAAKAAGDDALAGWCDRWLHARDALLFAARVDLAT